MRSLTKSEQLNYFIKRMVKLALKETAIDDDYYVAGTKLYTVTGDTVSDTKVILGSGTVVGTKLIL